MQIDPEDEVGATVGGRRLLSLRAVSKAYNLIPVLENIHLDLQPHTLTLLSAPNGSGKTTLLQVMAGLSKPTSGEVVWDNHPIGVRDRLHIGVVLQPYFLYGDLTVRENLRYYAGLYGLRDARERVAEALEQHRLVQVADTPVHILSKGLKQRASFARAVLHEPKVLLLDEPFDGMDADASTQAMAVLRQRRDEGCAVFVVTHQPGLIPDASSCLTLRYGRLVTA